MLTTKLQKRCSRIVSIVQMATQTEKILQHQILDHPRYKSIADLLRGKLHKRAMWEMEQDSGFRTESNLTSDQKG